MAFLHRSKESSTLLASAWPLKDLHGQSYSSSAIKHKAAAELTKT